MVESGRAQQFMSQQPGNREVAIEEGVRANNHLQGHTLVTSLLHRTCLPSPTSH